MRVGITGHQRLADPTAWGWVRDALNGILGQQPPPLVGVTSLAIGADQEFARAVLHCGGTIEVIIPFSEYADTVIQAWDRPQYDDLLQQAAKVEILARTGSDEQAYLAAGKRVAETTALLVAVWDGQPAKGLGGTADIVRYAQRQGKSVIQIDPVSREVSSVSRPPADTNERKP